MSHTYRQTISDDMAECIDARRGPLSLQDYTTLALHASLCEPPIVAELRAEIERLHATIRAMRGTIEVDPIVDTRLGW